MPRSARISTSSRSCSVSSSSLRLVKTPAMLLDSSLRRARQPLAQPLEPALAGGAGSSSAWHLRGGRSGGRPARVAWRAADRLVSRARLRRRLRRPVSRLGGSPGSRRSQSGRSASGLRTAVVPSARQRRAAPPSRIGARRRRSRPALSIDLLLPKEKTFLMKPSAIAGVRPPARRGRRSAARRHARTLAATISPGSPAVDRGQRKAFGAAEAVALDQDRLRRADQRIEMPAIGRLARGAQPGRPLLTISRRHLRHRAAGVPSRG